MRSAGRTSCLGSRPAHHGDLATSSALQISLRVSKSSIKPFICALNSLRAHPSVRWGSVRYFCKDSDRVDKATADELFDELDLGELDLKRLKAVEKAVAVPLTLSGVDSDLERAKRDSLGISLSKEDIEHLGYSPDDVAEEPPMTAQQLEELRRQEVTASLRDPELEKIENAKPSKSKKAAQTPLVADLADGAEAEAESSDSEAEESAEAIEERERKEKQIADRAYMNVIKAIRDIEIATKDLPEEELERLPEETYLQYLTRIGAHLGDDKSGAASASSSEALIAEGANLFGDEEESVRNLQSQYHSGSSMSMISEMLQAEDSDSDSDSEEDEEEIDPDIIAEEQSTEIDLDETPEYQDEDEDAQKNILEGDSSSGSPIFEEVIPTVDVNVNWRSPRDKHDVGTIGRQGRVLVVNEMIKMGRHTKIVAGGRIMSVSALILIGDGYGTAGLGYGKGPVLATAVKKAFRDAQKNALTIPLFERRTLNGSRDFRYKKTRVLLTALDRGQGRRSGLIGGLLAEAFGLQDISVRFIGKKPLSPHNMCRTFFKAIEDNEDEKFGAAARGERTFDPKKAFRSRARDLTF